MQNQKGEFRDLFEDLLKRGYLRARVDGEIVNISDAPTLRKHHKHNIEVVIDRLVASASQRTRVAEAVEQALKLADGRLICSVDDLASPASDPAAVAGDAGRPKATAPVAGAKPLKQVRRPSAEADLVAESMEEMEGRSTGGLTPTARQSQASDRLYSATTRARKAG